MKTLADRLKIAIHNSGMTQREVAEKSGITEVSLSKYVKGQRVPKAPVLGKIAYTIGVTPNDLLDTRDSEVTEEHIMLLKGLRDSLDCLFRTSRFNEALNLAIEEMEKKL